MVIARYEDDHPGQGGGVTQFPAHGKLVRDLGLKGLLQGAALEIEFGGLQFQPHPEGAVVAFRGVLVQIGNIGPMLMEEIGYCGDDAGLIGTADQKSCQGIHGSDPTAEHRLSPELPALR